MSDWFSSLFNMPSAMGAELPPELAPGMQRIGTSGAMPMVSGPEAMQPNALVPQPQERRTLSETVLPPPPPSNVASTGAPPGFPGGVPPHQMLRNAFGGASAAPVAQQSAPGAMTGGAPMNPWDPMTTGPGMAPPASMTSGLPNMRGPMPGAPMPGPAAPPPGPPLDIRSPVAAGVKPPPSSVDRLMATMKGIQAPATPTPQRVATPRAPTVAAVPQGRLLQLMQQLGLQGALPGIGGLGGQRHG